MGFKTSSLAVGLQGVFASRDFHSYKSTFEQGTGANSDIPETFSYMYQ